jgi:hypothetical protein
MKKDTISQITESNDLFVIELEDRLEFGSAIVDSDLDADSNSGCTNLIACQIANNTNCANMQNC